MKNNENVIDEAGTNPTEAREILEKLNDSEAFENIEELALALGRDVKEIQDILDEKETMDEDLLMKARGIAQQRDIEIS